MIFRKLQPNFILTFCYAASIFFYSLIANATELLTEQTCRVKGYAYELKCTRLPKQTFGDTSIGFVLYRIQAKARYPLADPLVYIPGTLSKSSTSRALSLSQAYARILTKRDFIWLEPSFDSGASKLCRPANPNTISEYLASPFNQANQFDCLKRLKNYGKTYRQLILEHYSNKLLISLAHLNINKINVVTEGAGLMRLKQMEKRQPHLIKQRVLFNPVDENEDTLAFKTELLQQSIASLDALCKQKTDCLPSKSTSSMLTQLFAQLPKRYTVNHPVNNRQEQFELTSDYLFRILESALLSDGAMVALPSALNQAIDNHDVQPLLGISSYGWRTETNSAKINWDIAFAEKCMSQSTKPKDSSHTLTSRYQRYLWDDMERACSGFQQHLQSNIRKTDGHIDGLIFSNQKNEQQPNSNKYFFYLPQFKGDLLTHGCATDIIYKYVHKNALAENDVVCLKSIPPLSPKILLVRP